jgi:hypothetical protein
MGGGCSITHNTSNGNGIFQDGLVTTSVATAHAQSKTAPRMTTLDSGSSMGRSGGTGYGNNQFSNNNGGNANPQVSGGIEMGTNICGGDTTCP